MNVSEKSTKKNKIFVDYFTVDGTPGGNQDWHTDFWMHIGGCAALSACDLSICLAKNRGVKKCCPIDPNSITKQDYLDFSMKMKPYIRPRIGGVSKISLFTEGYERYLLDCGLSVRCDTYSAENDFGGACAFLRHALEKNIPVAFLLLHHQEKQYKDLNWHWFMLTGCYEQAGKVMVRYHTYGEIHEIDFHKLWDTGRNPKGGMVTVIL